MYVHEHLKEKKNDHSRRMARRRKRTRINCFTQNEACVDGQGENAQRRILTFHIHAVYIGEIA